MSARKPGLGKKLSDMRVNDLLGQISSPVTPKDQEALRQLPIVKLLASSFQPRIHFDNNELEMLSESIKTHGIVQPLVVRPQGDYYEIVAGERRFRAAQLAGLDTVPCIVRELDNQSTMALALIENMQRTDLNVMEQAEGLLRLVNEFSLSHEELGQYIGKSRAQVSNLLRLLQLDSRVQQMLRNGVIDMGHARSLLTLNKEEQYQLAQEVQKKELSVRQLEALIRLKNLPASNGGAVPLPDALKSYQRILSKRLGTKVSINQGRSGAGKIVIRFASESKRDELLQAMQHLSD